MTFVALILFGMRNCKKEGQLARTDVEKAQYIENIATLRDFAKDHGIKIHIKSDTLRFIGELPPKSKGV